MSVLVGSSTQRGMVSMMKVVSLWNENKVLGTVKGLTFYNNNGATKTFQTKWQMKNWLNSYGCKVLED